MTPWRPSSRARFELGQFSAFINPAEVTGDQAPTTPPTQGAPIQSPPVRTIGILTGIVGTGISAATAYVGISYGMEKGQTAVNRALGWTVGVLGALSGLVRLVGTGVFVFAPDSTIDKLARRPGA